MFFSEFQQIYIFRKNEIIITARLEAKITYGELILFWLPKGYWRHDECTNEWKEIFEILKSEKSEIFFQNDLKSLNFENFKIGKKIIIPQS